MERGRIKSEVLPDGATAILFRKADGTLRNLAITVPGYADQHIDLSARETVALAKWLMSLTEVTAAKGWTNEQ